MILVDGPVKSALAIGIPDVPNAAGFQERTGEVTVA